MMFKEKEKLGEGVKRVLLVFGSLVLHAVFIFLLWDFWRPVAAWYLSEDPIPGIDVYNSATYVSYIQKYMSTLFSGWKYISYQGSPLGFDYTVLYFYLMGWLARGYGLLEGITLFAVVAAFCGGVFAYLLYWELSNNRALALFLALAVLFSANVYRALIWAGGIPYFTSQAILPLALYLLVKYRKSGDLRWFLFSALSTGLGMLGHPQAVVFYTLPSVTVMLLCWVDERTKIFSWRKIKELLGFMLLVFMISGTVFARLFYATLLIVRSSFSGLLGQEEVPSQDSSLVEVSEEVKQWSLSQVQYIWSDTNSLLWITAVVVSAMFFVALVIRRDRLRSIWGLLTTAALPIGVIGSVMLYARGQITFIGGWYKVFWAIPVLVGVYDAWVWGNVGKVVAESSLFKKNVFQLTYIIGKIAVYTVVLVLGYLLFVGTSKGVIERIDFLSISSSAYPTALNSRDEAKRERALGMLAPYWFPRDEKNYRLYEIDATVNIWWSVYHEMPLARGYADAPTIDNGTMFWFNAAIGKAEEANSSLEGDWQVPQDIVMNNLLYLFDWEAIKYLEGNHASEASAANLNPDILTEEYVKRKESADIIGNYLHTVDEAFVWRPEGKEQLNYFEMRDELVSPILYSSNAPAVLVIGDDEAYNTISRVLGDLNLNSRYLVFVKGPKFIDEVKPGDLLDFDLVMLYGYDYRSHKKVWSMLEAYLKNGGSLFIDTGREVKESDITKNGKNLGMELPGVFPITKSVREGLGYNWRGRIEDEEIGEGIDINNFSNLDFDGEEWNISYPPGGRADLTEGAKVILSHEDKPVLVRGTNFGGKVIWSGFNFPYHTLRDHNKDELQLFRRVLESLVGLTDQVPVNTDIDWISNRRREVAVGGAKGVVFKEQAYKGWKARMDNGKKLRVFPAGPTYPGFMYVVVPEAYRDGKVIFEYRGEPGFKFYSVLSLFTIVVLVDFIFFKGFVFSKPVRFVLGKLQRKTSFWWDVDEY